MNGDARTAADATADVTSAASEAVVDADLSALNTFGLQARAARLLRLRSVEQVQAQIAAPGWVDRRRLVLGGGSNLVLTGDFPGTVLKVDLPGRRLLRAAPEAWIVEAGAGENWHDFVRWTLAQGWPGLENLALIPGTVGAAPVQNIGAYGLEIAERFHSLTAWDFEKQAFLTVDRNDCRFAYRV